MPGPLFALAMGWSRVYLDVHYPSDVLAGWTGAVGWVAGLHMLFSPEFHQRRRFWREALHRPLPIVVAAPGEVMLRHSRLRCYLPTVSSWFLLQ